jgi:Flp pilus assembly protein TadG
MLKSGWPNWLRLARDSRGTELAESAMIMPLLFMVLLAIFWFGQAYRIYGTLTHATRAGAEAAVAPVCATCAAGSSPPLNAQTAVQNAVLAARLDPNKLVPWASWTPPTLLACGSATAVTCDGSVSNVCVQNNVQLSLPSKGGMGTCGISVSAKYQYPYHFRVPFTSLDLGNMLLPGQAQMRGEKQ